MIEPMQPSVLNALRIVVRGQVQGVGFRPFVYRLAQECQLTGSVRNTAAGVVIEVEGSVDDLARFQTRLVADAPHCSHIDELLAESISSTGHVSFVVEPSDSADRPLVRVPRDLALCTECRADITGPSNRRRHYPFTNCTACGPRYSILSALPYDRPRTTMCGFRMCPVCDSEYRRPEDRRFHAQPNACPDCGPRVVLGDRDGATIAGPDSAIVAAAKLLCAGQIVAVKGIGGFQLLVRADQPEAVQRLRHRKHRPSKPLAVMVSSMEMAERLAILDEGERQLLRSAENPIVLTRARPGALADGIAPRSGTIGLFLPTTPLHCLLLDELGLPVVATSGNRSEEPIVLDEGDAVRQLVGLADAFLVHDRPIVRRVDDSVARVIAGRPTTFRLGRGYAPLPLPTLEGRAALATGGHQKVALALCNGSQSILAQHIGDLDHPESRQAFLDTVRDLTELYQFAPAVLACDLHPDFFSTNWAAAQGPTVVQVQHHHAHAVACMAEHDLLDREVLAFTWDGTGYGVDGTIWGGECLRTRAVGFSRVASLFPFPLPGGDSAIRHPNRVAFGLLHQLFGEETLLKHDRWTKPLGLALSEARLLSSMICRSVNTPWTSSIGRLFDALAALTLGVQAVSYEGESAIWLEAVVDPSVTDAYPLPNLAPSECMMPAFDRSCLRGDWRPMLRAVLDDLDRGTAPGTIAARFHNALAGWVAALAASHPLPYVVLSGGCFQNRFLAERTRELLLSLGRRVFLHEKVPPGDGGLAVGQLAVALSR